MTVRYRQRQGVLLPDYTCQREGIAHAVPICQSIAGAKIDEAIGQLLLELVAPVTLDVALEVQQQLQARLAEADGLRQQQVERARYEADLAGHRFLRVDPNHRLVADELEADWNEKLRALTAAQQQYEQQRQADQTRLDQKQREAILSLASDFPRLWRDERTPQRERKRMVRLLIEDVTLIKAEQLTVHVRLRGGAVRTLTLPRPLPAWRSWQTDPEIVAEIDRLLDEYTTGEIATQLNERGLCSGKGRKFTHITIVNICHSYRLKSRYDRLRAAGLLTRDEIAKDLGIAHSTVSAWRKSGLLKARLCRDHKQYLYEPVRNEKPVTCQGRKLSDPRRFEQLSSLELEEV